VTQIKKGDRVRARDPDTGEDIVGHFQAMADAHDGIEAPHQGETRTADDAWVRLDDGTSLKVACATMRPA
jgi:hypothetical protein